MYDPMVAKLIVWDVDREQATARMLRALAEYEIEGLKTLIPFHNALLGTAVADAETCRDLVEDKEWLKTLRVTAPGGVEADDEGEKVEQAYTVEVSGRRFDVASSARRRRAGGGAQRRGARRGRARARARRAQGAAAATGSRTRSSPRCRATCGRSSSRRAGRSRRAS